MKTGSVLNSAERAVFGTQLKSIVLCSTLVIVVGNTIMPNDNYSHITAENAIIDG